MRQKDGDGITQEQGWTRAIANLTRGDLYVYDKRLEGSVIAFTLEAAAANVRASRR